MKKGIKITHKIEMEYMGKEKKGVSEDKARRKVSYLFKEKLTILKAA